MSSITFIGDSIVFTILKSIFSASKIGLFHGPISGLKTDLGFEFGEEAYEIEKFDGHCSQEKQAKINHTCAAS